jgi:hypothetical protein
MHAFQHVEVVHSMHCRGSLTCKLPQSMSMNSPAPTSSACMPEATMAMHKTRAPHVDAKMGRRGFLSLLAIGILLDAPSSSLKFSVAESEYYHTESESESESEVI